MSDSTVTVASAAPPRSPASFTVAQWQELEHQALIFKYLKAGFPVPPCLLAPIRKSFQLVSPTFFHHATLDYYSYYGKKIDSEPGRCRRTDGKKWRCSKDAHPDSKYCERHMNRSRNRSRKPVESPTASQSMSTLSSEMARQSNNDSRTFSNIYSPSVTTSDTLCYGSNVSRWQMESLPYISSKEYRSLESQKAEADEHAFLPEASGSSRNPHINSTVDHMWRITPQILTTRTSLEPRSMHDNYPQLQIMQDLGSVNVDTTMLKQQQQNHGSAFGSSGYMEQENQSLHPLFDKWPKCSGLNSHLVDQRSNEDSSTIQLSMVNPIDSHFGSGANSSDNGRKAYP